MCFAINSVYHDGYGRVHTLFSTPHPGYGASYLGWFRLSDGRKVSPTSEGEPQPAYPTPTRHDLVKTARTLTPDDSQQSAEAQDPPTFFPENGAEPSAESGEIFDTVRDPDDLGFSEYVDPKALVAEENDEQIQKRPLYPSPDRRLF